MCIVPVKVKYGDSKDMITTYAMLDNCSQSPFIHDQGLGQGKMKTTLNLKILHGEKQKVPW